MAAADEAAVKPGPSKPGPKPAPNPAKLPKLGGGGGDDEPFRVEEDKLRLICYAVDENLTFRIPRDCLFLIHVRVFAWSNGACLKFKHRRKFWVDSNR